MTDKELTKLAIEVMGGILELDHFAGKRRQKAIPRSTIRQMFMTQAKSAVYKMSDPQIAEICICGKHFTGPEFHEYREDTIVTKGTNAWSAVFLSPYDTGFQMLQKIAVATILTEIIRLLSDGMPDFEGEGWMPIELRSHERIDELEKRGEELQKLMGW